MSQPTSIAISSTSPNLSSKDFKGDTKTGDPPSPPLEQEPVQVLTREDVAVKLMDELEKDKKGESSKVWNGREKAATGDHGDVDEEDHVDGLLSPTGEKSMVEERDSPMPDKSPVTMEGENASTPLISDGRRDYISSSVLPSTSVPEKGESKEDPAPISPIIEGSPTAPAVPPGSASIARYPMGNRRPKGPKGWISSLNHPRAISNLTNQQMALTPPRSSSTSDLPKAENRARVSSVYVHQQQRGGARRISGTMQYAFVQPQLQTQSQHTAGQGPSENEVEAEAENEGDDRDDDISFIEDNEEAEVVEQLSAENEARIRYEVGLSQDQDEIWMEYVRNQLSSLFPDFFGADPGQLQAQIGEATYLRREHQQEAEYGVYQESQRKREMEGEGGEQMGMEDGVERIGSPLFPREETTSQPDGQIRSPPGAMIDSPTVGRSVSLRNGHDVFSTPATNDRSFVSASSSTDFSSLPTPPLRSNAEMLRGNVVIPNVRDEIGGLRDEIERLRSVVGGLAQELGGGGIGQQREIRSEEVARENEYEIDGGIVTAESQGEGVSDEEQGRGHDAVLMQEEDEIKSEKAEEGDNRMGQMESGSVVKGEKTKTEKKEQVSEVFLKTANISAEIIRLLGSQISKSAKRDTEGSGTRSDEEVFSTMNLEKIMRYVKGLGTS
ncbi:hypothetical protein V865_002551 [Kwoniella europaea PYCC6329]|uniref:Uncharacterized protein n=1 Tax=Kwoniella europaea PYCC6329 TaxID=1423913 RepID=A0AAX4KD35_9TREE